MPWILLRFNKSSEEHRLRQWYTDTLFDQSPGIQAGRDTRISLHASETLCIRPGIQDYSLFQ